jgi:hypothetical protein
MKIFGKTVGAYFQIQLPFLFVIVIVGLLRLILPVAGVPESIVQWLSLTVLMLIGMVYAALLVHTSGFGAYRQLLPVIFLQAVVAQGMVMAGIALAIVVQQDNIFTGDGGGRTWGHVWAHAVGAVFFTVILWVLGSVILFVARTLRPARAA